MKHLFIILALIAFSLMLTACRTTQKVIQQETQNTSIETRYEKIYINDTVYIEIPAQVAERTTRDSTSHLENDYATSEARINMDGTLYHDLKTKPQEKSVPIKIPSERKDSIVYVDKEVKVPVMVEKDLTAWQSFRLKWFNVLVAVLLGLLIWTFRTPLMSLIRKFI